MRSILVKLSALFTILVMVTLVATSCFLYSNDDSTLDLEDEILVDLGDGKIDITEEREDSDYTDNDHSTMNGDENNHSTEDNLEKDPVIGDKDDPNFDEDTLPLPGYFESMFPEGWTGGFGQEGGHDLELWWVETYEELLIAIEKLNSHGSTFDEDECSIVNYEGDLFDVKYCIFINPDTKGSDRISFGDDPFDRCAINVAIYTWCFFDDVTIDEINYSYVQSYRGFLLRIKDHFLDNHTQNNVFTSSVSYTTQIFEDRYYVIVSAICPETSQKMLSLKNWSDLEITSEIIDSILIESKFYFAYLIRD